MRNEMLKRLDEIIAAAASVIAGADCGIQAVEDDWPVLRAELAVERCENCLHWTAKLPEGENRPGTCCGWETGMFSIESKDEFDHGVFWTWSDFGCKCFKPKTREV